AEQVAIALTAEETRGLANLNPNGVQDALLCALGQVLTGWIRTPSITVAVEAHGRDAGVTGAVGWFTRIQSFRLTSESHEIESGQATGSEILFNYLGRVQSGQGWKQAAESTGPQVSPRAKRSHFLEVIAYIAEGRLQCAF